MVTGASRGIGRAVAERLSAEGCRVLMVARDRDVLAEAARTVEGSVPFVADVTDAGAAARIVAACLEQLDGLDVVVNNAGGARPQRLERVTPRQWREAFELNLFAAVELSLAAVPVMRRAGWGRLVHVASVDAREPDPLFAPYSAAKAALVNVSTSLSHAYAGDGVLSSCVVAGTTMTELVAANAASAADRLHRATDDVMAAMLERQRVAVGRFGEPSEIADAVVFLASERAAWITGATVEVDGGTLRSV